MALVAGVRYRSEARTQGAFVPGRYGCDCVTRAEPVASSAARRHSRYFGKPSR